MERLYRSWPKAGGLFSVLIILFVLLFSPYEFLSLHTAAWLNLAFLMLHQFEEYVYPGGFKDFFNNYIYKEKGIMKFRLNDISAFHVNVTLGWTAFLISAIAGTKGALFFAVILAITFINGIVHTAAAIVFRMYNPGFVTGTFVFVPFSLYISYQLIQSGAVSTASWLTIVVCTAAGTLIIPLTLFLFREK
jgi:hypothetical protein